MEFSRCYSCMQTLDAPGAVCPHCGYDNTAGPAAQPDYILPCGTVLDGRYVIGKKLGQGGFGISYIAYNLALDTTVCIKEYFPAGAAMRSAANSRIVLWSGGEIAAELRRGRESFVKEARKAVKLRDLTHVVKVWDVFYENETAYIVMDYIEGKTLRDRLLEQNRPLDEKTCFALLSPVMEDLEQVHARDIIHRDIKPDNLMLTPEGNLMLLDLGAAKDLSGSSGQSSQVVASHGFSPLEQYREHGNIGPWTDVYAMCATIFYCVRGKALPTAVERVSGVRADFSAFSPAVAAVLEKGLAVRPEDRIQSMGELRAALKAAIAPAPGPKPPPKPRLPLVPTPVPTPSEPEEFLLGSWGDPEAIHNGTTTAYYLYEPVRNCSRIKMELTILSYTGYPFGDWALYLMDESGNWESAAYFRIEKEQGDGREIEYLLYFDKPRSFRALTICPAEKGMEQQINRILLFYSD